jgi:hypothetical protein
VILKYPEVWGEYLKPWAIDLPPASVEATMRATDIADIVIGFLFLVPSIAWVAGILGVLHMLLVLVTSGITDMTVSNIGLLGASAAIVLDSLSFFIRKRHSSKTTATPTT